MKARFASLMLALALVGAFLVGPGNVVAQENPFVDIPVTGTLPGGALFTGTLDIVRFAVRDGALVALGTINGSFPVAWPVDLDGTCDILTLVLGPLHLDVLGLVVDLNQVELEITAESAPGNLLGNLLCQIAGLLDRDGPLQGIARLLNQIIRILG